MEQHTAYFELNFRPNVQLVSVVRRFVSEFYQRFLFDPDGTSRVALATHELLENAVKYSKDGETTIRIEVEQTKPKTVRVILRNRAEPANIAAIREIVDGISKADDAFAFYQQLIVKKAKSKEGSGLGLARICAEGEMKVAYEVLEGDMTVISATTQVGDRS
jgi:anti-sigma regulatory factor (Ser/Thr protein kinase)